MVIFNNGLHLENHGTCLGINLTYERNSLISLNYSPICFHSQDFFCWLLYPWPKGRENFL